MVIFEAMAHGLPIIVSDQAAAGDYVENGKNGFICPLDKDVFLEKLNILSDQKTREKMGVYSSNLVKEKYWLRNKKLLEEKKKELFTFIKEITTNTIGLLQYFYKLIMCLKTVEA